VWASAISEENADRYNPRTYQKADLDPSNEKGTAPRRCWCNHSIPFITHSVFQQRRAITGEGWIRASDILLTIDTGASVTTARPGIMAGLPEREYIRPYILQMA
jgi:hypothetical protein